MAHRRVAGQAFDHAARGEMIAHQAKASLRAEALAVKGHDARRLLAAMLKGVQAQRRDGGRLGMAENAENAAFLA